MNTLFRMILVIVFALALCAGCSTDPGGNTPHDSSITNPDGGSNDSGNVGTDKDGDPWTGLDVQWNQGAVSINLKTPDGQPADFMINGNCQTNEIKNVVIAHFYCVADTEYEESVWVTVTRTNYLFVPWMTKVKGHPDQQKTTFYTHEWTETGSWGLAPNGVYVDSSDNKTETITTNVKNNKVTIDFGYSKPTVTNNLFFEDDSYGTMNGEISPDLSKITYQYTKKDTGKVYNGYYSPLSN